ncbi:MAG: PTS sugar transporter subunit IIC [Clostridia bacterium]|nr:PTS sugar transporter subunit IIC [Clostridia bacterium]
MAEKTKFDFAQFIKKAAKRYFLDAMSAMALGLFASLIIGLIISQLSKFAFLSWLAPFGSMLAASSPVVGSAIGVACAFGLKVKPLAMLASAATGAIGYDLGGPVGAYVASVVGAELGNLIAGKTPVDIVLVPIVTIITGGLAGTFVGPGVSAMMSGLGAFINTATEMNPVPMGIIVSTVVGMVLTLPISSAALCISLGLEGIAAGAAAVGCSAQMIGFAVMSYRENKFGGLLAQGLGTSMLQVPNIFKNPLVWIPPTLASAILGPISTAVLGMVNNSMGAGMGTSGLVGQFGAWAAMSAQGMSPVVIIIQIVVMHVILPAILTLIFSEILRKIGWIKENDLKLDLQ